MSKKNPVRTVDGVEIHVLFTATEIRKRIVGMAGAITARCRKSPITLVAVLDGALPLVTELRKHLPQDTSVIFVRAKSYTGTQRACRIRIEMPEPAEFAGRHVFVIDDVFDSGRTTGAIAKKIRRQNPAALEIVVLVNKNRRVEIRPPDVTGFEALPEKFLVGFGMDLDGRFRELDFIGWIEKDRA